MVGVIQSPKTEQGAFGTGGRINPALISRPKKDILTNPPDKISKTALAKALNVSRQSLYYIHSKPPKDWSLKVRIEEVLREHHSYGSRRIAWALGLNRKGIQRVMRQFGIKPRRRRGKKWRKKGKIEIIYQNLLFEEYPRYINHIWAADFTELSWQKKKIYVATVIDLYSREILGLAVSLRKGSQLTLQALYAALLKNEHPKIFHSDNGKEYIAKVFLEVLNGLNIQVSRSHPGCPWENGYQESFYDKFQVDLGDPNRFNYLGELVAEIYRTIWIYNNTRIHSSLKMPPVIFARQTKTAALATANIQLHGV